MALQTRVAFTFGHTITDNNQFINFSEDGGSTELAATIEVGSYTLGDFTDAIAVALNDIGALTYAVVLDRTTRKFTISATGNFDLLVTTGTQVSISAYSLMGFTTDRSSADTYEGDAASGSLYIPQAPLKNFIDFEDTQEAVQSKVNESSSGIIEVVSYGSKKLMECNIKYATDIDMSESDYIDNNATGIDDLRLFMEYIVGKKPIEFIRDKLVLTSFDKCLLEKTSNSSNGTGFQLRELYSEGLAFYFESGKLEFRLLS